MEIKKIGVIGLGIMGAGIAQICAQAGYEVVATDINDELVTKGLSIIKDNLLKRVKKKQDDPGKYGQLSE